MFRPQSLVDGHFYEMSLTVGTSRDRDQAIEHYKALLKKKKDLGRKNRALQTKISQYIRKNKIDLEGKRFRYLF